MTKNTTGGKKAKGFARKHASQPSKDKLVLSTCDFERYAIVTKMLGNGMFYALTDTNLTLIGHIRNKFKGRSKHSNFISVGSFVLIGLRDWEQPNFKNADLIHIFDDGQLFDVHNFHNISSLISFHHSNNHTTNSNNTENLEDGFQFSNTIDTELDTNTTVITQTHTTITTDTQDIIDIDDI